MEAEDNKELVFGLIGPVGTDLITVVESLKYSLQKVGYYSHHIKLSKLMESLEIDPALKKPPNEEEERIDAFMEAGNRFRAKRGHGDAVALLGLSKIRELRQKFWKDKGLKLPDDEAQIKPVPKTAYILDSLKHKGELETLKKIYGDAFILISVYDSKENRIHKLVAKIIKSHNKIASLVTSKVRADFEEKARKLVEKDEKEANNEYGQSVSDIFHFADLFVSDSALFPDKPIDDQINRFIKLLFGSPFITPTKDEYGIFHAHSVALKSADLSRQVGAIILTEDGEIVSAGCNEVPSIGGHPFWEEEKGENKLDTRDFTKGEDPNAAMKHNIISEVFGALKSQGWLSDECTKLDEEKLCQKALYETSFLKEARAANIIEFGRIVHAEMSAITDAARRGRPLKETILYCTTFPCHGCARHILASGIKRVVFIEPYPKSMTNVLYKDVIRIDGDTESHSLALSFEPFIGLSPNRFFTLFSMSNRKRKDKVGKAIDASKVNDLPTLDKVNYFATKLESLALEGLDKILVNPSGK